MQFNIQNKQLMPQPKKLGHFSKKLSGFAFSEQGYK
jgi:hypothetical protein